MRTDIKAELKKTDLTPKDIRDIESYLERGIHPERPDSKRLAVEIRKTFTHIEKGAEAVKLHKLYSSLNYQK